MATMFDSRWMMRRRQSEDVRPKDDCVLQGSLNCSETGNSDEAFPLSPSLPGVSSWVPLAGSSAQNASRLQPSIGHGDANKEDANENERKKEEDKGAGFGPRLDQEARIRAARTLGRSSGSARSPEYLAEESRGDQNDDAVVQQPLLFSKTFGSNGDLAPSRYSPGFISREGLPRYCGAVASHAQVCIANENAKEDEKEEEERKKDERGGGSQSSFHRGQRPEAVGAVSRKAASVRRTPETVQEANDDAVVQQPLLFSKTFGSNGGLAPPRYSPGFISREGLPRYCGAVASHAQVCIANENAKEDEKEDEKEEERKQDERGGGSQSSFHRGQRPEAVGAVSRKAASVRRTPETVQEANDDAVIQQPLLFSKTFGSNGGLAPPRYSPGFVSREGLPRYSRVDAAHAQFCIAKENAKEGEHKEDQHEEEKGGGSHSSVHRGKRLEAVGDVSRKAASDCTSDTLQEAWSLIKRQRVVIHDLAADNKRLTGRASCATNENTLLRRQRDAITRKYEFLLAEHGHASCANDEKNTLLRRERDAITRKYEALLTKHELVVAAAATAAERARQEKMHNLVGKANIIMENARLNRGGRSEQEERFSPPPIARERYLSSAFSTSLTLAEDDEMSPAARASALLGRDGTPPTGSITPTEGTPVVPAAEPAACPAAFRAGVNEARAVAERKRRAGGRASNSMRQPTTSSSGGTRSSTRPANQPAASRTNTGASSGGVQRSTRHTDRPATSRQYTISSSGGAGPSTAPVNRQSARRQSTFASAGDDGSSARPVNRPSARRSPTTAYSAGVGSSKRPTDRPSARRSKETSKTNTCRLPLGCTKGTIASQRRSRMAVTTSGRRGMVF